MDLSPFGNLEKTDIATNSNSNQLLIEETLDLPDDKFRMSFDNFSDIAMNVTIGERNTSVDIVSSPNFDTTTEQTLTPADIAENIIKGERNTPVDRVPCSNLNTPTKQTFTPTHVAHNVTIGKRNTSVDIVPCSNLDTPTKQILTPVDIAENVTVGERNTSVDIVSCSNLDTTTEQTLTPVQTPTIVIAATEKSPPILETPKLAVFKPNENITKLKNLLKLSLTKKNEEDIFVRPSPVTEVMSPARMLQFEMGSARTATPTMKRTIIDFDFFDKNRFEEYFDDLPKSGDEEDTSEHKGAHECKEAAVIMKGNTVRHEIGYGKCY